MWNAKSCRMEQPGKRYRNTRPTEVRYNNSSSRAQHAPDLMKRLSPHVRWQMVDHKCTKGDVEGAIRVWQEVCGRNLQLHRNTVGFCLPASVFDHLACCIHSAQSQRALNVAGHNAQQRSSSAPDIQHGVSAAHFTQAGHPTAQPSFESETQQPHVKIIFSRFADQNSCRRMRVFGIVSVSKVAPPHTSRASPAKYCGQKKDHVFQNEERG
jgi:hypothetical protein